jgi:hypothetical protein
MSFETLDDLLDEDCSNVEGNFKDKIGKADYL